MKLSTSFLTLLLLFGLISCQNNTSTENSDEAEQVEELSTEPEETTAFTSFKATGNEPSWELKITLGKMMSFKTMASESFELNTPVPEAQVSDNGKTTTYYAETEGGKLEVTIISKQCGDGMSDKRYNYTVNIKAKTGIMENFEDFNGCGEYL